MPRPYQQKKKSSINYLFAKSACAHLGNLIKSRDKNKNNMSTINNNGQLTSYRVGSLKELWVMSYPLMLMAFSTYAMIFVDRLIVARYSVDAMNSVGMVMMVFESFHWGILMLALIAEVFVGQYNGSGQEKRIGEPVWQMMWLALMSILIFWPAGLFLGEYVLLPQFWDHGVIYYKVIMLFGPLPSLIGALSAFYIGRGQTKLVTAVVAIGNIINLGLDIIFVFGVEGYLNPMGTKGAALATGISLVIQAIILATVFLKAKNRQRFGTGHWHFKWKAFKQCISIGWPNAVSANVSIAAWVIFFRWISEFGFLYLTTLIICQNYFYIFSIITEGIGKAVTAICANLIGAKRHDEVRKVLLSGIKLVAIFGLCLAIPLVIYPNPSIEMFVGGNVDPELLQPLITMAKEALLWMWVLFFFWGAFWLLSSQLTAAGDTRFIMYLNMLSAWLFLIVPAYLALKVWNWDPSIAWKIMVFDIACVSLLFYLRYRTGKWKHKVII